MAKARSSGDEVPLLPLFFSVLLFLFQYFFEPFLGFWSIGMGDLGVVLGIEDLVDCELGTRIWVKSVVFGGIQ